MSSDLTRADRLIARLESTLRGALPPTWRVADAEAGNEQGTGITVYYEQGDVTSEWRGDPLPFGYVGVSFTLTLTAAVTEPVKGTRAVTAGLFELLPVLDALADLYWGPDAEKILLETGETCYRIPVLFLSTLTKE